MTIHDKQQLIIKLAGKALIGMLSNPNWMINQIAKNESNEPNRGDVPACVARFAVIYAERVVEEIERKYNI